MFACAKHLHARLFLRAPIACCAALLAVALSVGAIDRARAADPTGLWLNEDRDARIHLVRCGDAVCGTVVWIRQPHDPQTGKPWVDKNNRDPSRRSRPLLGITIVSGMKPDASPGRWVGKVYSVIYGRLFAGSLAMLGGARLKIEGCMAPGLCQSEIWTRAD